MVRAEAAQDVLLRPVTQAVAVAQVQPLPWSCPLLPERFACRGGEQVLRFDGVA
jgi:hypothetical protein